MANILIAGKYWAAEDVLLGGWRPQVVLTDAAGTPFGAGSAPLSTSNGAPSFATGAVVAGAAAATLLIARLTRRYAIIYNEDAVNGIYWGPATVTSGNGFPLAALQSIIIPTTALIQFIAAAGTPSIRYADFF